MIRTQGEYDVAMQRLAQDRDLLAEQRRSLSTMGLSSEEVERAMQPAVSFHEQLKEEVEAYERLVRGDVGPINSLTELGRLLIGLRIAQAMTQRELAERLGVAESVVSRDERNEYRGVSVARAQRVLDAIGRGVQVAPAPEQSARPATARSSRQFSDEPSMGAF